MATWQVSMYLIPKSVYINKSDKKYDIDSITTIIHLQEDSMSGLEELLGQNKSWSDSIIQYGLIDSTCIEMITANNYIEEIHVRLDLRNITREEIDVLIKFANKNELSFLYESKIYNPTLKELKSILLSSDAYKFVNNPIDYLRAIK